MTHYYSWAGHRCAYDLIEPDPSDRPPTDPAFALLLIHPVGVGLCRQFWQRFITEYQRQGLPFPIYNPDLLGFGDSDLPARAYAPADWAEQLITLITTEIQKPVVLVVQGGLFPVAVELVNLIGDRQLIKGLIPLGPPAGLLMSTPFPRWKQQGLWALFKSPLGDLFYRYARRRQFLKQFSIKELFDRAEDVDEEWLWMLRSEAKKIHTRYGVLSFLAGFWRQDYRSRLNQISQPTLVIFGKTASNVSKNAKKTTLGDRTAFYEKVLARGQVTAIRGRNVLPYESTQILMDTIKPFLMELAQENP